jgi:hypothetical protein
MSDDRHSIPVDLITQHQRFRGLVPDSGRRIADTLADPNTDILEMLDATASSLAGGSEEMHFRRLFLRKSSILMIMLHGEHEAPVSRRNRYVEKYRYGAMIVLPGHILSGILHLGKDAVPARLLGDNTTLPSFLGMTDVTLHSSVCDRLPSRCNVAIFHRQFIEAVQLTEAPLAKG